MYNLRNLNFWQRSNCKRYQKYRRPKYTSEIRLSSFFVYRSISWLSFTRTWFLCLYGVNSLWGKQKVIFTICHPILAFVAFVAKVRCISAQSQGNATRKTSIRSFKVFRDIWTRFLPTKFVGREPEELLVFITWRVVQVKEPSFRHL